MNTPCYVQRSSEELLKRATFQNCLRTYVAYQPWHVLPSRHDSVFPSVKPSRLPTRLAPFSCASDLASAYHCPRLRFTYLVITCLLTVFAGGVVLFWHRWNARSVPRNGDAACCQGSWSVCTWECLWCQWWSSLSWHWTSSSTRSFSAERNDSWQQPISVQRWLVQRHHDVPSTVCHGSRRRLTSTMHSSPICSANRRHLTAPPPGCHVLSPMTYATSCSTCKHHISRPKP